MSSRARSARPLLPLPARSFELVLWHHALVHRDGHAFDHRLYSVPWTLVGQHVWLRATPTSVTIYANDVRVATHGRRGRMLHPICQRYRRTLRRCREAARSAPRAAAPQPT